MKISECAKLTGISIDTLRYYEKVGLLKPNKNNYAREYSAQDIEIIKAIRILKSTGMRLEQIKLIVDMEDKQPDYALLKAILLTQLDSILVQENNIEQAKKIINGALKKISGVIK